MILSLIRNPSTPQYQSGALQLDGTPFCRTLEPAPLVGPHPCIPAGTYTVTVEPTHNPRLWSPMPDHGLPRLQNVPGRTGILIHAGNSTADTEGCILVGFQLTGGALAQSRAALLALMVRLGAAVAPHSIVVVDLAPTP